MTDAQRIPVDDMQALLNSADATALLGEYDIGPTWYDGAWWHVPTGELDAGFVRADDESSDEYYRMFRALTRSALALEAQFRSDDDDLELLPGREPGLAGVDGGDRR